MAASDRTRLSVAIVEVRPGCEEAVLPLIGQLDDLLARKQYALAETIRDETVPSRFYAVRQWTSADAARRSHADPEVSALRQQLRQLARVSHVINGAQQTPQELTGDRRAGIERDRREGFDRRIADAGRTEGNRRAGPDRRLGPRRQRQRASDLVGAARRARDNADAAFSNFKVGAALETAEGAIITGCNIENASYGLTMCAERVAMFKALSDGHRAFTRLVIVTDAPSPTPPCGACRQILWEFGGNLEIRLANLTGEHDTYRLRDLLPLPFDARILA